MDYERLAMLRAQEAQMRDDDEQEAWLAEHGHDADGFWRRVSHLMGGIGLGAIAFAVAMFLAYFYVGWFK